MDKITLTRVTPLTTDKAGNPLMGKNGKPYTRLLINCNEYGEKALSGFQNASNAHWQVGQQVDVIVEKVNVGGKEYLNFKMPEAFKVTEEEWKGLLQRIAKLEFDAMPSTAPATPDIDIIEYPDE